jgi:hypothetical protein
MLFHFLFTFAHKLSNQGRQLGEWRNAPVFTGWGTVAKKWKYSTTIFRKKPTPPEMTHPFSIEA